MNVRKSCTSVGEQIISITSVLAGISARGILSRPSHGFVYATGS
jgi:hypothetical protein